MDVKEKLEKVREFAASDKAYIPPKAIDPADIHDLDEKKLQELREVRMMELFSLIYDNFLEFLLKIYGNYYIDLYIRLVLQSF